MTPRRVTCLESMDLRRGKPNPSHRDPFGKDRRASAHASPVLVGRV
jgi:hypothetical protein